MPRYQAGQAGMRMMSGYSRRLPQIVRHRPEFILAGAHCVPATTRQFLRRQESIPVAGGGSR